MGDQKLVLSICSLPLEEGGTGEISKFHCFTTHFTLISYSSETTKGRVVEVYTFLKLSSRLIRKLTLQDHGYGAT